MEDSEKQRPLLKSQRVSTWPWVSRIEKGTLKTDFAMSLLSKTRTSSTPGQASKEKARA